MTAMAGFSVGITGGLASGKSTLTGWFKDAGCAVLDADQVVANLYRPGEAGAAAVQELFGPGFLKPDGSVDRDKVAGRVFGDSQARAKLEAAVHPLVRERVRRWLQDQQGLTVVEATLLIESGLASDLDLVVVVSAEETLRAQRAAKRGLSPHQVEARLAAQSDDAYREAAADVVIRNNAGLEEFEQRARELIATLKQRGAADPTNPDASSQSASNTRPLLLVTGNPGKLAEARRMFSGELESAELDLPEPQSLDIAEILEAKASHAWRHFERELIVEETALELAGLNGFPGPLVKWMLKALGAPGLARTAIASGTARATARCRLLYVDADRRIAAEGVCRGELVLPARGEGGFGWDPVFQPEGSAKTYAEMSAGEKDAVSHRGAAWREMKERLVARGRRGMSDE